MPRQCDFMTGGEMDYKDKYEEGWQLPAKARSYSRLITVGQKITACMFAAGAILIGVSLSPGIMAPKRESATIFTIFPGGEGEPRSSVPENPTSTTPSPNDSLVLAA